ncbi:putative mucin TcSMUGL [Trypanosoma cruzi]|uniref:Putative mucin TcSMUGL n=2 Tax=Trypanosoma cruzi TaxID=5693 RepID=A0A2V2X3H9_TRYCR|nr:putative mucin TcSMUGL [Trypanosoma cruzi]PWV15033.1 putative mucin TcSMUGL [Trypanosoma cruzi]
MISGSGQQPRRICFFSSGWVCLLWAVTVCVCVCAGATAAWRGCSVASRSHSPAVSVLLCVCLAPARVSSSHAACSRCARPVPARRESLHREQQAKSTKAQVTMMLRRVLCVLVFALCCACVCATAQEEGQYDAAVFKAAGGDPKKNTTTTTTTSTTTSSAPKNTTTTTSKAPTPEDARSPGGPVWVPVPLLLLVSAAVATAGAAC